ncbi:MAG TPA: glutaredoxin domain-containing protein [Candidatus Saccharimonadia bacterium]|nr:glutaredoxin domain-containing protein [Candidatus Saccharimonadia bacterium]
MANVKIYSTSWCAFCRAEKRFLTQKGVKFEDVDVEADQKEAEAMVKLSGQMGVPYTVITKDDGSSVGILGFDQPRIIAELGLA